MDTSAQQSAVKNNLARIIEFPRVHQATKLIPFSADELRVLFGRYSVMAARGRANYLVKLDSTLAAFGYFYPAKNHPFMRLLKVVKKNVKQYVLVDSNNSIMFRGDALKDAIDFANSLPGLVSAAK